MRDATIYEVLVKRCGRVVSRALYRQEGPDCMLHRSTPSEYVADSQDGDDVKDKTAYCGDDCYLAEKTPSLSICRLGRWAVADHCFWTHDSLRVRMISEGSIQNSTNEAEDEQENVYLFVPDPCLAFCRSGVAQPRSGSTAPHTK